LHRDSQRPCITNAIVTAGGDSRLLATSAADLERWYPRPRAGRGEVVAVLPLADVAISTSGDYERFFEEDGVRYHHIINPRPASRRPVCAA